MKCNTSRELVGQTLNKNKFDKSERPLVINVAYTQYEILQEVAKENNFTTINDEEGEEDWDIWWIDGPIFAQLLQKMKPY